MARIGCRLLLKALVVLLSLEVADTPLFCANESSSESAATASGASPSRELRSAPEPAADEDAACFCPCHLSFEPASRLVLVSLGDQGEFRIPLPAGPPASFSIGLDHPPQNLA